MRHLYLFRSLVALFAITFIFSSCSKQGTLAFEKTGISTAQVLQNESNKPIDLIASTKTNAVSLVSEKDFNKLRIVPLDKDRHQGSKIFKNALSYVASPKAPINSVVKNASKFKVISTVTAGDKHIVLDHYLRNAIILLLVALILFIFAGLPGVGFVFAIIGSILAVIALVFLILWLLNEL